MDETIKILETYAVYDLSSKHNIVDLISRMDLPNSNQIILDITGCITDYNNTSLLIDVILSHIDKYEGYKKLTILYDGLVNKDFIYADLFLGSKFINISDKFRLNIEEWNFILNELKEKKKIEINIEVKSTSA